MESISTPKYTPPVGLSPFMQSTHFAQQAPLSQNKGGLQHKRSDSFTSPAFASQKPRFGFNRSLIRSAQTFNNFVGASRGRELLVIDLLGFTAMRTLLDLGRQYLYKQTIDGKRQINVASARERLVMETSATFSDFLVGFAGLGIGAWLDKKWRGPNNQFIQEDHLRLFNQLGKGLGRQAKPQHFVAALAKEIAGDKSAQIMSVMEKSILKGSMEPDAAAGEIAKVLQQAKFERKIAGNWLSTEALIQDAKLLLKLPQKAGRQPWQRAIQSTVSKALRANDVRIPVAIALGIAYNFTVPYLIQRMTRNVEGINDYPGEMGLRQLKTTDPHDKKKVKYGKYLRESLERGNIIPALVSLVPLPFVLGMIDTDKLSQFGLTKAGLKAAFNNPLKKSFGKRLVSMMQFSRSFPFAGGQQIAMLYSLALFSRIASSRTGIEFRERAIDSFLGWSIWILANPMMKKFAARLSDKHYGTQLIKKIGNVTAVKSEAEILKLIKNPVVRKKSMEHLALISTGSTLTTILLLGLLEPILSIKLTEWQSRRENQRQALYH